MERTMETKPVYDVAVPASAKAPVAPEITGPVILEHEPGMFVDLAQAIEAQLIDGELLLVFGAPTDVGRGPHVVSLSGEPRDFALAYLRWRAGAVRAALRPFLSA
jgi:hypothetical protein